MVQFLRVSSIVKLNPTVIANSADFEGLRTEFIGVVILVFFGGLSVVHNMVYSEYGSYSDFEVILTHAIIYQLYLTTSTFSSGNLLNPMVTVVFVLFKRLEGKKAIFYIPIQLAASICGSALLRLSLSETLQLYLFKVNKQKIIGFPSYDNTVSVFISIMIGEFISGFVVIMAIYMMQFSDLHPYTRNMVVAWSYAVCMSLKVGPVKMQSANILRVFGFALVEGEFFGLIAAVIG